MTCEGNCTPRVTNGKLSVQVEGDGSGQDLGTIGDERRGKDVKRIKFLPYIYLSATGCKTLTEKRELY